MFSADRACLARKIVSEILYINIATADIAAMPWNTPLFTACDESYSFYWASACMARHSCNIRENPHVAATIYDSTIEEGKGEAVYMEGLAKELTPDFWQNGLSLLRQRAKLAETYFPIDQFQTLGDVRIYHFTPQKFYMLRPDGGDERVEIDIFQKKQD